MKHLISVLVLICITCASAFSQGNTKVYGLEIDLNTADFYGTPGIVFATYEDRFEEIKTSFNKYFAYGFNSKASDSKTIKYVIGLGNNTQGIVRVNNIHIDNDGDLVATASLVVSNTVSKPTKITADGDSEQGEFFVLKDNTNTQFMFHLYLAAYTLGVNARKALIK